jgi:hypothetical protein
MSRLSGTNQASKEMIKGWACLIMERIIKMLLNGRVEVFNRFLTIKVGKSFNSRQVLYQ